MVPRIPAHSCCTTPAAMCYWAAAFILLSGAGLLLTAVWPALEAYGHTVLLVTLGAACLLNFRQNRTLHCSITGPLFLLGALAAAPIEAGIWTVDLSVLWGIVLVGVGLAFTIEWRTVNVSRVSAAYRARQK